MSIDLQSSHDNGVVTLTIPGEMDMNTSTQVREHFTDLFKNNPKAIIVDLSKVSFMDSFGLANMVVGLQWSHKNNTKFRLASLTPMVKDVFAIANLLTVFEIYDSKKDALEGI